MSTTAVIPVFPTRLEWLRRPAPSSSFEVVARRVGGAAESVAVPMAARLAPGTRVDVGAGGSLRVDARFELVSRWPAPTWQARGRLVGHGLRLAPFARVNVQLTSWSSSASELRLQPRSRRVRQWGLRRQRRYFALAHAAADAAAALLAPTRDGSHTNS